MDKTKMPVCPKCNTNDYVCVADFKEYGTHYCSRDMRCEWFTPMSGDTFKSEFERRFPTLSYDFIQIMNDIGNYGLEKYGEQSMEAKFKLGDFSRFERTLTREILRHATIHGEEFIDGILHDKFGTSEHQLGAGAFNFMMEYRFRSKK